MLGLDPPRKARSPGKREAAAEQKKKRLRELLHDRPHSFGINRASWNLISLAKAYTTKYGEPISRSSVSKAILQAGYSMKKARRVLMSPDPEYREKVEQVLKTLQNLKPNELFFFIDELGPLRVKKYGGRILAAQNDVPTFPQAQAYKGSITMAGGLSATTNQVTWLYSPAKDTNSMIDLIEILFNQNPSITRIYLTWDAASWHSSVSLIEWLDFFECSNFAKRRRAHHRTRSVAQIVAVFRCYRSDFQRNEAGSCSPFGLSIRIGDENGHFPALRREKHLL